MSARDAKAARVRRAEQEVTRLELVLDKRQKALTAGEFTLQAARDRLDAIRKVKVPG